MVKSQNIKKQAVKYKYLKPLVESLEVQLNGKKVSDSQVAGIKAHAEAKNKKTIDKVNKAIDKLKKEEQTY